MNYSGAMSGLSLSISIPAYNEAATLPDVIRESISVLQSLTSNFEVVVIDDGSTDQTAALLQDISRREPRVKVTRHASNQGLGVTLREVFELPAKDVFFFVPGDGQIPPAELKVLLPGLEQADIVIGWRKERQDPLQRRVMAYLYNVFISALVGRRIQDVDSVVLVKRAAYQSLNLKSRSAFRHAELVLEAQRRGLRWIEIPIRHLPRRAGGSKITNHRILWPLAKDLLAFMFRS